MSIHRHDFNLRNDTEGRELLLEIYNVKTYCEEFKNRIDEEKLRNLMKIKDLAKDLETFTHRTRPKTTQEGASHKGSGARRPSLPTAPESLKKAFDMDDVKDVIRGWGLRGFSVLPSVSCEPRSVLFSTTEHPHSILG